MSNNNKMKGLLKGLRYISQIFDNEKEPEMQIGYPTDVKHVAHIGWDGPSVNSPSWMTEFKSPPAFSSAPLNLNGEATDGPNSSKWVSGSGDSARRRGRVPNATARDLPELPKASRRQQPTAKGDGANSATDSPTRGKSEKTRHRRSSKNASNRETTDSPKQGRRSTDSSLGTESPARNPPEIPKKSRRKKSKDANTAGGSSRSGSRARTSQADQSTATFSDPGLGSQQDELSYQKPLLYDEADEIKESIT